MSAHAEAAKYAVFSREQTAELDGLGQMQALLRREIPPPSIARTLNFWPVEVERGRAVFAAEPTADFLNPLGVVHGGWALTLIDTCTGCAAHSVLPAGVGYTTLETKTNFVRAISPTTGPVRAEGVVIAQGRTIITTEGKLTDAKGRLLAHGTSTLMVLRPQGAEEVG
ncbi:MAG: PaaI family thioesterase [Hyphomonadaceae bacterium]